MLARRQGIGVSAWCAVAILILVAGLPTALGGPPATVQLLADRSAAAPGQGIIDFGQFMADLRAVGYDGWGSFEDFSDSGTTEQKLRRNLGYIRSLSGAS